MKRQPPNWPYILFQYAQLISIVEIANPDCETKTGLPYYSTGSMGIDTWTKHLPQGSNLIVAFLNEYQRKTVGGTSSF
jgi:hypothetical protein